MEVPAALATLPDKIMDHRSLNFIKELGSGATGYVQLMSDHEDNLYAVKIISRFMNEQQMKSFVSEIDSAAFVHPCIVQVVGFDFPDRTRQKDGAIIMEYVEGQNLTQAIADGRLTFSEKVSITAGIALALKYVHSLGFMHRDLKPSNVCLTKRLHPKLIDFGLAKVVDDTNTVSQGTFRYMAPEISSKKYDQRVDIFSFALMLFELFIGPIYPDESDLRVHTLLETNQRPPFPQGTDAFIQTLISKCWQHDPNNRPSFAEIVEMIRSHNTQSVSYYEGLELKAKTKKELIKLCQETRETVFDLQRKIDQLESFKGKTMQSFLEQDKLNYITKFSIDHKLEAAKTSEGFKTIYDVLVNEEATHLFLAHTAEYGADDKVTFLAKVVQFQQLEKDFKQSPLFGELHSIWGEIGLSRPVIDYLKEREQVPIGYMFSRAFVEIVTSIHGSGLVTSANEAGLFKKTKKKKGLFK